MPSFQDAVFNELQALDQAEPGKFKAINWALIGSIVSTVDSAAVASLPVLDTLLPAQWDAVAKIVAAGIHAANHVLNPPAPAPAPAS